MNADLQRLDTEVTMALAGLDVRATQSAPRERSGKWTIQEIAEHLHLALDASIRAVRENVETRAALPGKASIREHAARWLVLSAGWFPPGRKAAERVTPNSPVTLKTGNQLADRLHAALVEFDRLGILTRKVSGEGGAVATHKTLGDLTLAEWSRFHLVHGQHHLKQIARIRREWRF